jgi:hypothetical protein
VIRESQGSGGGLWWRAAAVTIGVIAAACSNPQSPPNAGQVVVTPDSVDILLGTTQQLGAAETGGGLGATNATFSWASADPSVATVDQTGMVKGVGKGKTVITATTGNLQGQAIVRVLDPSGGACPGVDTVETWTGTLDVRYGDTLISGSTITGARDELRGTFTLTRDPSVPPGSTQLRYVGDLGGTVSIDESITGSSSPTTNVGSGTPGPGSQLELDIDADACTWQIAGGWGVDATETAGSFVQHFTPEAVANLTSKEVPLGVWPHGLSYTAGFPAYLGTVPPPANPTDGYYVLTAVGILLFADPTAARGPASVAFEASPE